MNIQVCPIFSGFQRMRTNQMENLYWSFSGTFEIISATSIAFEVKRLSSVTKILFQIQKILEDKWWTLSAYDCFRENNEDMRRLSLIFNTIFLTVSAQSLFLFEIKCMFIYDHLRDNYFLKRQSFYAVNVSNKNKSKA